MSKKDLDFGKLSSKKKPKVKKQVASLNEEQAISAIHEKQSKRNKRVTIDLPHSLYMEVRKKALESEITLREYFIRLSKQDLNN